MKKQIGLAMIALLLFGCSAASEDKVKEEVTNVLKENVKDVDVASINRSKPDYSFFLPHDMGVEDSTALGSVLLKDGYKIVLNFTPSAIIISEYYVDFEEKEEDLEIEFKNYTEENLRSLIKDERLMDKNEASAAMASDVVEKIKVDYGVNVENRNNTLLFSGNYKGKDEKSYFYQLQLKRVNDTYYIHFDGTLLTLTSIVPVAEVDDIVYRMLVIAKSVEYDKEAILKNYSLQYELEKMQQRFEEQHNYIYRNLPAEGYLEDLLNQEEWNSPN